MTMVFRKDVSDEELKTIMSPFFSELMREVKKRIPIKSESANNKKCEKNASEKEKNLTNQGKELLDNVFEKLHFNIQAHRRMLGLNNDIMNRLKREMINNGFIDQFTVNLGKALGWNNTMLALTDDGFQMIGKRPAIEKPDNVSHEHWWFQIMPYKYHRSRGMEVEIEKVLNGKRADFMIVWNGKKVAYEVELSPQNAVGNIIQDLDAGFEKVVSCAKNSMVLKEIQRQLAHYQGYESIKDKVELRLLYDFEFVKEIAKEIR